MMLDINNVFSRSAPLYLRLLGASSAGLIGASFPLLMENPTLMSPKMCIAYAMLLVGMCVLIIAMRLGMKNGSKP